MACDTSTEAGRAACRGGIPADQGYFSNGQFIRNTADTPSPSLGGLSPNQATQLAQANVISAQALQEGRISVEQPHSPAEPHAQPVTNPAACLSGQCDTVAGRKLYTGGTPNFDERTGQYKSFALSDMLGLLGLQRTTSGPTASGGPAVSAAQPAPLDLHLSDSTRQLLLYGGGAVLVLAILPGLFGHHSRRRRY